MKKKMNWKVFGSMAACLAVVLILGIGILQSGFVTTSNDKGDISDTSDPTASFKPVINFEGVVAAVEDGRVTLEDGTVVLITEDTEFGGDPDTGNAVSEDIQVGNYIQGYTADDADAEEITANRIWANF